MAWQGKAVGAAVGSALGPVGAVLGAFVGHHFDRKAEGQEALQLQELQNRKAVFALGVSAGQANGSLHAKERKRLIHFGRQVFGNVPESEISGLIDQIVREPLNIAQCAEVFNFIANEYRPVLVREMLSILYADSKLEDAEVAWVNQLLSLSGSDPGIWGEVSAFFARGSQEQADRNRCLHVLGLPTDADATSIKKAYHQQANQYHPDKLAMVPDPVKRLAEEKLKELNLAYETLTRADTSKPDFAGLVALHAPGLWREAQLLAAGDAAICALCGQRNRLPVQASMLLARCGQCYALLILPNYLLADPPPP